MVEHALCSVHWRVGDSSEGGGKISERHKARPKAREKRKRGEGWDKNHHPSIHNVRKLNATSPVPPAPSTHRVWLQGVR